MDDLRVSFSVVDINGEVVHECYEVPIEVALAGFKFFAYMNYIVEISHYGGNE